MAIDSRGAEVSTKALRRHLEELANTGVKKVLRGAVGAGMTQIAKGVRTQVNASPATPAVKKAARKQIGKRFAKSKSAGPSAKVGFGVGAKGRRRNRKSTGFISSASIHLFVLGTAEREQKSTGQPTGRIEPMLKDVVSIGALQAAGRASTAAAEKARQILQKEAAKMQT